MGVPLGIMPYKLGLLAVEHTDEGYASVGRGELEEFLEHAVALRDMLSKAPIPSTERMVWFGLVWERVVSVWTMASVPARVDNAYWCGWHAAWKVLAYCCAMQRETKRRSVSPTMMPRTLPLGFCKATRRSKAIAVAMVGGTRAWARSCVTWPSWAALVSSSKSSRSVSVVRPEGPGAAPLRARRRLRRIMVIGMSAGRSGSNAMTSGAMGSTDWIPKFVQGLLGTRC